MPTLSLAGRLLLGRCAGRLAASDRTVNFSDALSSTSKVHYDRDRVVTLTTVDCSD